jgi:tetratricopeptide (TPR) repeat protein
MEMSCARVKRDELIEAYVLGTLDEDVEVAFEQHIFSCPDCLDDLETLRVLQHELAAAREAIESAAPDTRQRHIGMWAMGIAAAAVLAVAAALLVGPLSAPDRPRVASAEPAKLADLQPAPYKPVRLRGQENDAAARFREAMGHYQNGDYEAAAAGLRQAVDLDPQAPNAGFYLGVSLLLAGDTEGAIESLHHTIALGDTLYLEMAHFYLFKAYLIAGDVEAARTELRKTRDLEGDLETEAERLLGLLPVPGGPTG